MDDAAIISKLGHIENLPTLPSVAINILQMVDDENSSLQDIANELQREPALSLLLVRMANSAYYGSRSSVSTVSQALSRIGFNAAVPMIVSFSVKGLVQTSSSPLDLESYWRRSVLASCTSAFLSRYCDTTQEEALLAGLIQDVGLLVLSCHFQEQYQYAGTDFMENLELVTSFEVENFGCDHSAVSAALLKNWEFPNTIVDAVRASHSPPGIDRCLKWCVSGSDLITACMLRGIKNGNLADELKGALAFHWLGLPPREQKTVLIDFLEFVAHTEQLFEVDILPGQLEQIISEYEKEVVC